MVNNRKARGLASLPHAGGRPLHAHQRQACRSLLGPPSCRPPAFEAQALDLLKPHHVVNQIGEGYGRSVPRPTDAPVPRGPHTHHHRCEDVLHSHASSRPRPVGAFLFPVQGSVAPWPLDGFESDSALLHHNPAGFPGVGAVGISGRVTRLDKSFQNLAVVDGGVGDRKGGNKFTLAVDFHVVLVAKVAASVFSGPPRVNVLLTGFRGLLLPAFGNPAALDEPVFLTAIVLSGDLYETGVDHLPFTGDHAHRLQSSAECGEEGFKETCTVERLAKSPDRFLVGGFVGVTQPQKALEAHAVSDLELGLMVAQPIKTLDHQHLEHQPRLEGGSASRPFWLDLRQAGKDWREYGPIDDRVKPCERIPHLVQFFESRHLVEQCSLNLSFDMIRHAFILATLVPESGLPLTNIHVFNPNTY